MKRIIINQGGNMRKAAFIVSAFLLAAVMLIQDSGPVYAEETDLQQVMASICQDVVNRMPVDEKSEFTNDTVKVYCWSKIQLETATPETPVTVIHRWIYKDKVMAEIELNIAGNPWRTWSYKTLDCHWTGEWKVEIVEKSTGEVLKTVNFAVVSSNEKKIEGEKKEEIDKILDE